MEQTSIRNAKFLIVDDELSNVRLLERMLEEWECFHQGQGKRMRKNLITVKA